MKQSSPASPRALFLLAATALCSTPLLAQEAATPPPVVSTVPPPAAQPAPAPAAPAAPTFAPRQEVVQPLPARPAPVAEPAAEEAAPVASTARSAARPARARVQPRAVAAAPVANPAPVAEPAPTPPAIAAAGTPNEPDAAVAPAPESAAPAASPAEATPANDGIPTWLWAVGGALLLLAALGLVARSRRRSVTTYVESAYVEPTYVEPAYDAAPVVPVAAEPVAAAVAPDPSEAERPWIRMTLEPTSSEVRDDAHVITYHLIVENEGPVDARNVDVSSFLFSEGRSSAAERSLIETGALRGRIDVPAGGSVRVEGHVVVQDAATRDGEAKIVADARYPLPDGGEGHLAARFAVDAGSDIMTTRVDDVLERV